MIAAPSKRGGYGSRNRLAGGVALTAIALALSSCAGQDPDRETETAMFTAGPPLPLLQVAATDWVDGYAARVAADAGSVATTRRPQAAMAPAGPSGVGLGGQERPIGPPLQLIPTMNNGLTAEPGDEPTIEPVADVPVEAEAQARPRNSARQLQPIDVASWAEGQPLQLIDADRPDWLAGWRDDTLVAELPVDDSIPLVLSDGSYYWLYQEGAAGLADSAADQQLALADGAVDDSALSELRGGFVTTGGFQVDFGYYIETLVDGVTELTTVLTLDDMLSGATAGPPSSVGSISLSGAGDTATSIEHVLTASDIGATIQNTQSNVSISTIATLAINVVDLRQTQTGLPGAVGAGMPMEFQQSIIRGLSR